MHDVHAVKPVEPWKKPVEQLVHTVAEAAEYLPAAQFSQLDEPAVPWNLPAAQLEQTVAEETE